MKLDRLKHATWLIPIVACLIILFSIGICIQKKLSISDSGIIIQAGATLALAILTWGYLVATSKTVKSTTLQAELTRSTLDQARQSRIQSIRPLVTMRYIRDVDDNGDVQYSTWLVNTGSGTACNINLYWNVQEHIEDGQWHLFPDVVRDRKLRPSALNNVVFGFPLIADKGSKELRIRFHTNEGGRFSSPLHIPGLKALIVYEDTDGNVYKTRIHQGMQQPDSGKVDLTEEGVEL